MTTRTVACVLTLLLGVPLRAQTTAPAPMPNVPDEPLPEWHPPTRRLSGLIFLSLSPEVVQAQKLRQAGISLTALGWVSVFTVGITYEQAVNQNNILSNDPTDPGHWNPAREDLRNTLEAASLSLAIIGGVMVVGGFALFTAGQWKISSYHKRHPKEPLPSLSGH
jgi:hypothetical protein